MAGAIVSIDWTAPSGVSPLPTGCHVGEPWAHRARSSKMGCSWRAHAVSSYAATRAGGGSTTLRTRPDASSSRRRALSTAGVMPRTDASSSPDRLGASIS